MDAAAAPEAEAQVVELLDEGASKLLLEWSGVDYLSSAGIRMLLAVSKKLRGKHGQMVLCNITENVMDVLKMSGFDHVLKVVKDREAGMAALGS